MTKKKPTGFSVSGTGFPESAVAVEELPPPAAEPAMYLTAAVSPVPDPLPQIDLATFCTVAGMKWDQLAGFRSYAQRVELSSRTVPEWRAAFQNFMGQPC